MCGRGHVWQRGCLWQGGMCGRGCVWQGVMHGRGRGTHVPPRQIPRDKVNKRAVRILNPTGMHSCTKLKLLLVSLYREYVEVPKFSAFSFVGALGGVLNLWTGITAIIIIEFLETIINVINSGSAKPAHAHSCSESKGYVTNVHI